jgi:hypothetical protein
MFFSLKIWKKVVFLLFVLKLFVFLMGVIGGIQHASVIGVLLLTLVLIFVAHVIGMYFMLCQGSVSYLVSIRLLHLLIMHLLVED